jgi:hypothetical protein
MGSPRSRRQRRLKGFWIMVACVFAALATIFGVVALILGVELSGQHPGVEWGTAPDWLAGLGTVAGFGALAVAALEWHTSQEERRWKDAAQARLIIAEPTEQGQRDFAIRNQSQLPVFDIAVDNRDGGGRLNFQNFGADPKGAPNRLPILQGGEATGEVGSGRRRRGYPSDRLHHLQVHRHRRLAMAANGHDVGE